MRDLPPGLPPNVREVVAAAAMFRESAPGVVAVALVGSWARGGGRPDSDVDIIVLAQDPERLLSDDRWFSVFGDGVALVRADDFGLLRERRLRRRDGLEVEVAIGGPEWAATDPPDAGSARVVQDGMVSLFDPEGLLSRIG